MVDQGPPNLPLCDFAGTGRIYTALGYETAYHSPDRSIVQRGSVCIAFFAYPELDLTTSSFNCCFRLVDSDGTLIRLVES